MTAQRPTARERREHERFPLNLTRSVSLLGETRKLPILNISYGGMCLLSSEPHEPEDVLTIAYRDVRMEIRVLECVPVVTDPSLERPHYRLRVRLETDDLELAKYLVDNILS